jgi:light-harvesting protein B-800-850 alpha chain
MIYGKLWCVVKPSVGIPLFLSAVAISSFAVHLTLLNTAPWLKQYYAGGSAKSAQVTTETPAVAAAPPTVTVAAAPTAQKP